MTKRNFVADKIIEALTQFPELTVHQIGDLTMVKPNSVQWQITRMHDKGMVARNGSGRVITYSLPSHVMMTLSHRVGASAKRRSPSLNC